MKFYKISSPAWKDIGYPKEIKDKEKLKFYNFLKSKNIVIELYHGTCDISWELMKKDEWMSPPTWRGKEKNEKRYNPHNDKESGLNKLFFTKNISYAFGYSEREVKSWDRDKRFQQYKIEKGIDLNRKAKPIVVTINVPLHELAEIKSSVYGVDTYNETGLFDRTKMIIESDISNQEKLDKILELINYSAKQSSSEWTVQGGLPLEKKEGFQHVQKLDDINFWILILKQNSSHYYSVPEEFKNDPRFFEATIKVLEKNPDQYYSVPKEFKKDPRFFEATIKVLEKNPDQYYSVPEEFKKDPRFFEATIKMLEKNPDQYKNIPKEFKNDPRIFEATIKVLEKNPHHYYSVPEEFKKDPRFIEATIKVLEKNPYQYESMPKELKKDPNFFEATIKGWINRLEENLREYKFIPQEVKKDPRIQKFAPKELAPKVETQIQASNWYKNYKQSSVYYLDIGEFVNKKETFNLKSFAQKDEENQDKNKERKINKLLPSEINLDEAYNKFKETYEEATGSSWSKGKFLSRASNWEFYGDEKGYITVRPQRSGMLKLVGMAGDVRSILKGLETLMGEGKPIWGMVSQDIANMAIRKGFKTMPAMLVNYPHLKEGASKIRNCAKH